MSAKMERKSVVANGGTSAPAVEGKMSWGWWRRSTPVGELKGQRRMGKKETCKLNLSSLHLKYKSELEETILMRRETCKHKLTSFDGNVHHTY